jgi:hypothetical protein
MNTIKETALTYIQGEQGITEQNLAERIVNWHSWKWRNLDGSDNFTSEDISQAVRELLQEGKAKRSTKRVAWRDELQEVLVGGDV